MRRHPFSAGHVTVECLSSAIRFGFRIKVQHNSGNVAPVRACGIRVEQAQIHENLSYQTKRMGLDEHTYYGHWSTWIVAYAVLGLLGRGELVARDAAALVSSVAAFVRDGAALDRAKLARDALETFAARPWQAALSDLLDA